MGAVKFVDISMSLSPTMKVYPGDPQPSISELPRNQQYDHMDSLLSFGAHNGTHLDAPKHFIRDGASLDSYPPERFFCRGVLVKATGEQVIEPSLLGGLDIQEGDAVLFWTGHTSKRSQPNYFDSNPVISAATARLLVSKKISIMGIDSFSPDNPPFEAHNILLAGNVLILENLVKLDLLEGAEFDLFCLPAKIEGTEAAPCRAIAKII